jgi:hypothetical protein
VASLVNNNGSCGFEALLVKTRPTKVVGDPGELGSLTWKVNDCDVGDSDEVEMAVDCLGTRRLARGGAQVDATRVVTGEREKKLLVVDSIIPRTPDAVTIDLTEVVLENFAAYTVAKGASVPAAKLTFQSGFLSARVRPVLGELKSAAGEFGIPTPVATLSDVYIYGAKATLTSGAKTIKLDIPEALLQGQAGTFRGVSNVLSGYVRLQGEKVVLDQVPLDPAFEQARFDQAYACTDDLRSLIR